MMQSELDDIGESTGSHGDAENPSPSDPPGFHHDQLPSVEEYKAQVAIEEQARPKSQRSHNSSTSRRFRAKIALCVIAPILILTIVIAASVSSKNKNQDSSPSPSSFDEVSFDDVDRKDALAELVTGNGWSNSVDVQRDGGGPQWEAISWLADGDVAKLEIKASPELRQRYALSVIYFALNGPNWKYDHINWLSQKDVCDWYALFDRESGIQAQVGVSCYNGDTVKELFLPSIGAEGTLPPEIGLLTELEEIDMFGNKITGNFPYTMASLTNMRSLVMTDNTMTGEIPDWMADWAILGELNLSYNIFSGGFPMSMQEMPSLLTLNLADNGLDVDIDDFSQLLSLQALFLETNNVHGQLGEWIAEAWPAMEVLDLSDNFLNGDLPISLFNHPTLKVLDLHGNDFTGEILIPIPEEGDDGSNPSQLEFLALHENELSGEVPSNLQYLSGLKHLDLSSNSFGGVLPQEDIFKLTELKYLFLAYNNFVPGGIHSTISQLTNLEDLSLRRTNRAGPIPDTIGECSNLWLLDLDDNLLGGPIPDTIGQLTELRFLFLQSNDLDGELPLSMSQLVNLNSLIISNNTFTGTAAPICEINELPLLNTFIADCDNPMQLDCPCCTLCCSDMSSGPCFDDQTFYIDLDPKWDYRYTRQEYLFNGDDIIFPDDIPDDGIDDLFEDGLDDKPDDPYDDPYDDLDEGQGNLSIVDDVDDVDGYYDTGNSYYEYVHDPGYGTGQDSNPIDGFSESSVFVPRDGSIFGYGDQDNMNVDPEESYYYGAYDNFGSDQDLNGDLDDDLDADLDQEFNSLIDGGQGLPP